MAFLAVGQDPFRNINARVSSLKIGGGGDGPPHAPRLDPKVTDAVIAAVREMAKLKTDSSVMQDVAELPELCAIDRLVREVNGRISSNPLAYGPVPIIRWGLFASDWQAFKEDLCCHTREAIELRERYAALRRHALAWARTVNRDQSTGLFSTLTQSRSSGIPWTKVFVVGGVIAGCIFAARYWGNRYARDDDAE